MLHFMSPNISSLSEYFKSLSPSFVSTADDTSLEIKGIGNFKTQNFFILKIRFIPKLNLNLLSVSQLSDLGCDIQFLSNKCLIQDHRFGKLIGEDSRKGDLYYVDSLQIPKTPFCNVAQHKDINVWHKRLRHPNITKLSYLYFIKNLCKSTFSCNDCILGKMRSMPFEQRSMFTTKPFEIIHSDVWGPAPIISKGGFAYYVILWMIFLDIVRYIFLNISMKCFHVLNHII